MIGFSLRSQALNLRSTNGRQATLTRNVLKLRLLPERLVKSGPSVSEYIASCVSVIPWTISLDV